MIDDIQEVRRLLAPANPSPRDTLAGAGRDALGRAAFHRITHTGLATVPTARRRFLSRRTAVRLVTVGGLAVALAAGTMVAQDLGGTDQDGRPRSILPGLPAANAQAVLHQAANAAQRRAFTAPRPDQWVYTETRLWEVGEPGKGEVVTAQSPLKPELNRLWVRADGRQLATVVDGKVRVSASGGVTPPLGYAWAAALPRDPDDLLAWAHQNGGPIAEPSARAYNVLIGLMLHNGALPPDLEAATYRAFAKIPGIEVDNAAVDGMGRPVVSISLVVEGYLKEETLLDRTTYTYRGHRTTIIKDHTLTEGGMFKEDTVESFSIRLATGIVDRFGQRP